MVNVHGRVTGGADVHAFDLDRILRDRGHEVAFLATEHPDNLIDRGAFVPQTVSRDSRDSLTPLAAIAVARSACWNRTAAAAMEAVLADFKPDIVHAHKLYPQLSVAPLVVAANQSVPIVQTAHDYEFVSASPFDDSGSAWDRDESRSAYQILNSLLFQVKRRAHVPRVTAWIAVSRDLAQVYREQAGIAARAIPNFVLPGNPGGPPKRRSGALFVGRLAPEKGIKEVIGVARRLPWLPVTIAGDGPLADAARTAAAEIPNLSFAGHLDADAVAGAMLGAQVVLIPSEWREPAGLVTLEAMRAGTPIVAYDRGGLGEYTKDAGAGIATSPNLDALVAAVQKALGDPDLWRQLSRAGLAAAADTHSPDAYLDQLESLYRKVAADSASRRPT